MKKTGLFVGLMLAVASLAGAQTVVGPATQLLWDLPGLSVPTAQACTHTVAVAPSTTYVPVIGPVTCVAAVPPQTTSTSCGVLLTAQTFIPIGSNSITMEVACSGVTSLPSTPFAYVDILIPIPTNLRTK